LFDIQPNIVYNIIKKIYSTKKYSDEMAFIYKIKNIINGKEYIGFTSTNIKNRWKNHVLSSKNPKTHLHKSISKYGEDNFTIAILEESDDCEYLLNERESFWIEKYNTFHEGYNMTLGGNGALGYKHDEEVKKKISQQYIDRWKDDEYRFKQSKNPRMYGKKHSTESRDKISKSNLGKKHSTESREKISDSLSTLYWVLIFPGGSEILIQNLRKYCRENNLNQSHLYQVAKGNMKSYKGIKCRKLNIKS